MVLLYIWLETHRVESEGYSQISVGSCCTIQKKYIPIIPLALAKNERYTNTLFGLTVSMLAYSYQIHAATRPPYRGTMDKGAGLDRCWENSNAKGITDSTETGDQLDQKRFWIKYNCSLMD